MDEWITIASIVRARGNRGEVAAIGFSDRPERFEKLERAFLFGDKGILPDQPVGVEEVWEHRGQIIFKFQGIDTISAAEALRGVEVRIPIEERAPLEEGEYYQSDLIGCSVMDKSSGEALGTVAQVLEIGAAPLLSVLNQEGSEILVPLAKSICVEVDVKSRRILAELPEGLRELNR